MLRLMLACVLCLAANAADASRTPRAEADDPELLDLRLAAHPGRGVAPLGVRLEVAWYQPGSDRILRVDWDFDGDDVVDACGFAATHVFQEPGAYHVVAHVVTRAHGTFTRGCTVLVHSAMMTLTFDDGHVTQSQYALPTLRARGVLPTAYVVPEWIEWREHGTSTQYVSWSELARLRDAGWDIGSHTLTHPHLPMLPLEEIRHELEASRDALADHGFPVKHFALPHGEYDERVLALVPTCYESNRATGNAVNPGPRAADRWLLLSKGTNWFKPLSEYRQYVDEAIGTGGWLILNSHIVYPTCGEIPYCVECSMLEDILDYAQANGVGLGTIDEIVSGAWERDPTWLEPGTPSPAEPSPLAARIPQAELLAGSARGAGGGSVLLRSDGGSWTITVHDASGRRIARIHDGLVPPGERAFRWDGRDDAGSVAASGVYFVRAVEGTGRMATTKTLILR